MTRARRKEGFHQICVHLIGFPKERADEAEANHQHQEYNANDRQPVFPKCIECILGASVHDALT